MALVQSWRALAGHFNMEHCVTWLLQYLFCKISDFSQFAGNLELHSTFLTVPSALITSELILLTCKSFSVTLSL